MCVCVCVCGGGCIVYYYIICYCVCVCAAFQSNGSSSWQPRPASLLPWIHGGILWILQHWTPGEVRKGTLIFPFKAHHFMSGPFRCGTAWRRAVPAAAEAARAPAGSTHCSTSIWPHPPASHDPAAATSCSATVLPPQSSTRLHAASPPPQTRLVQTPQGGLLRTTTPLKYLSTKFINNSLHFFLRMRIYKISPT